MTHIHIGNAGERIAREFCIRRGWNILHTNWRAGRGELDIIAQDGSTTVFIEVKSRTSNTFGLPEEAITPAKQQALRTTISAYCSKFHIKNFRVDVVGVKIRGTKARVRHLQHVELLPEEGLYARMPSGRLHR